MTQTFAAKVQAFADLTKEKMELVVKQSAQDMFSISQRPVAQGGRMPVDTGFLRNSFVSGLNGSTALTGPDAYVAVIAGMELGDSIFGGWTANYAKFVENGAGGRQGRFFALGASQEWQRIVAENAQKARNL
jgi:hypothetical protein